MTEMTTSTETQVFDPLPNTPSAPTPVAPAEVHQGTITGVLFVPTNNGGYVSIGLRSANTGIEKEHKFFPPAPFLRNIAAPLESYSEEHRISANGKALPSEKETFSKTIKNEKGDALLQRLTTYATEQGRSANGTPLPTDITTVAEYYNTLLTGTSVVFPMAGNPNDPRYSNVANVSNIFGPDFVTDAKQQRYFRARQYRFMWEG